MDRERLNQEKDSERKERNRATQELCSILKNDFAMGTFWTTFLSSNNFNVQFDFSKHTVIDGYQFNFNYGSYKRIDCLIVDATQKHGVVICFHPSISEEYPEPLEAGFCNLEEIVYVLFMPDVFYDEKLNNPQKLRYYFSYSNFNKWLEELKGLSIIGINHLNDFIKCENFSDVREWVKLYPDKEEKLNKYLNNLKNSDAFTYNDELKAFKLNKLKTYDLGYWLMEVCRVLGLMDNDQFQTKLFQPLFISKKDEPYGESTLRKFVNDANKSGRKKCHIKVLEHLLEIEAKEPAT